MTGITCGLYILRYIMWQKMIYTILNKKDVDDILPKVFYKSSIAKCTVGINFSFLKRPL